MAHVGDGATLTALTPWRRTSGVRRLRYVTVSHRKTSKQATVSAYLAEVHRGLSIVRGSQVNTPARAFEWDFGAGTATLAPTAPFAGTATFTRGPDGHKRFTGSLRAPILGEPKPVDMAGAAFRATLQRGIPHYD
jgi:hypothetical protein